MARLAKSTLTAVGLPAVWVLHPSSQSENRPGLHAPLSSHLCPPSLLFPHARAAVWQLLTFLLACESLESCVPASGYVQCAEISRGLPRQNQHPAPLCLHHTPSSFVGSPPCLLLCLPSPLAALKPAVRLDDTQVLVAG